MNGKPIQRMQPPPLPDRPLVSVLMPAYNAERFIERAIRSIIAQTYGNWELLVLDDASTDGTAEIIARFRDERIRFLRNDRNLGYLDSCNRLFAEAMGDLVTFQDADDTSVPERLEQCMAQFHGNPGLGFLSADFCRTDVNGTALSHGHHPVDYGRYATDPAYYPTVCGAGIMVRMEVLREVGGYHPFFRETGGEDYHWLFRLSRTARGTHLHEELYHYRTHPWQTHQQNISPLKFFAQDMDMEIRESIILKGEDPLADGDSLQRKWEQHIAEHPEKLLFRKASSAINRHDLITAYRMVAKGLWAAPMKWTGWTQAAHLAYSALRRMTG